MSLKNMFSNMWQTVKCWPSFLVAICLRSCKQELYLHFILTDILVKKELLNYSSDKMSRILQQIMNRRQQEALSMSSVGS